MYRRGNPQLRVFLPNFWMKLINPEWVNYKLAPNHVMFNVSPGMTSIDVKNYLEKIYKVPVMRVKTANVQLKAHLRPHDNELLNPEQPVLWGITYRLMRNFFTLCGQEFGNGEQSIA